MSARRIARQTVKATNTGSMTAATGSGPVAAVEVGVALTIERVAAGDALRKNVDGDGVEGCRRRLLLSASCEYGEPIHIKVNRLIKLDQEAARFSIRQRVERTGPSNCRLSSGTSAGSLARAGSSFRKAGLDVREGYQGFAFCLRMKRVLFVRPCPCV